jgi:hypothetical protein
MFLSLTSRCSYLAWSGLAGLFGPQIAEDGDLAWLKSALRGLSDAKHVFQAVKNGVDYFVTTDRGILSRAPQIEDRLAIKLRTPSRLLVDLVQPDAARES